MNDSIGTTAAWECQYGHGHRGLIIEHEDIHPRLDIATRTVRASSINLGSAHMSFDAAGLDPLRSISGDLPLRPSPALSASTPSRGRRGASERADSAKTSQTGDLELPRARASACHGEERREAEGSRSCRVGDGPLSSSFFQGEPRV